MGVLTGAAGQSTFVLVYTCDVNKCKYASSLVCKYTNTQVHVTFDIEVICTRPTSAPAGPKD